MKKFRMKKADLIDGKFFYSEGNNISNYHIIMNGRYVTISNKLKYIFKYPPEYIRLSKIIDANKEELRPVTYQKHDENYTKLFCGDEKRLILSDLINRALKMDKNIKIFTDKDFGKIFILLNDEIIGALAVQYIIG